MGVIKESIFNFQVKSLEEWTNINPILSNGEIAIVKSVDHLRFKIGNGVHRFNELLFVEVAGTIKPETTFREMDMEEMINIICAGA
jgi:hypothetical protein